MSQHNYRDKVFLGHINQIYRFAFHYPAGTRRQINVEKTSFRRRDV